MGETLHSVGIDVGTSTTQLIFSRLTVENRANAYAVPDFTIGDREILYRSPIHFTPPSVCHKAGCGRHSANRGGGIPSGGN